MDVSAAARAAAREPDVVVTAEQWREIAGNAQELVSLSESLKAERDTLVKTLAHERVRNGELRAIVGEQGERLFGLYAEEDRLAGRVIEMEARASEQADKIVRYEAELARVYLIANQYLQGRSCGHCRRIIEGRPAETSGLSGSDGESL